MHKANQPTLEGQPGSTSTSSSCLPQRALLYEGGWHLSGGDRQLAPATHIHSLSTISVAGEACRLDPGIRAALGHPGAFNLSPLGKTRRTKPRPCHSLLGPEPSSLGTSLRALTMGATGLSELVSVNPVSVWKIRSWVRVWALLLPRHICFQVLHLHHYLVVRSLASHLT